MKISATGALGASVVSLWLIAGETAGAATLLYEGFDIPVGWLADGQAGASSFGFSSGWDVRSTDAPQIVDGSIAAPASVADLYAAGSSNGRIHNGPTAGNGIPRYAVRNSDISAPALYASLLVQTTASGHWGGGGIQLLFDSASPYSSAGEARLEFPGNGVWGLSLHNNGSVSAATDVLTNNSGVQLALFEFAFNYDGVNDRVRLWLNDNPLVAIPDAELDYNFSTNGILRQFIFTSGADEVLALDELRVGESWADVGVAAVPAPATAWLLGSGLFGLAGALRRNRRVVGVEST